MVLKIFQKSDFAREELDPFIINGNSKINKKSAGGNFISFKL